ncbi:hypothetical protein QN277_020983 [Acacia crassicarpa]|uniref:Reverse transcriptase Ty1/copia-type domain-containing protein n=1 Tax=Acacia crassicarpa TaxID=499986 RepID=A0AAE1JKX9_9FABA|nr:hypothetical protein QN277_020983 [Acacia crassicarpa]
MVTRAKRGVFKPKSFAFLTTTPEYTPTSIDEALTDPHWSHAATDEYDALIKFGTWDLVPLPPGRHSIGCKWLFKKKFNANGYIIRYKGRLVAQGFSEEICADYTDTFSPVVKPPTIRTLLTLAVSHDWKLHQVDFNNAFLNDHIQEEVYMDQPPGFIQASSTGAPLVCRLKKAIYGLKQAPRAWFQTLCHSLASLQFTQSKADPCLLLHHTPSTVTYLIVYVDDLLIFGSDEKQVQTLIQAMSAMFSLKDLGDVSYFLGVEFTRTPTGLLLSQKKYIRELLKNN